MIQRVGDVPVDQGVGAPSERHGMIVGDQRSEDEPVGLDDVSHDVLSLWGTGMRMYR